MSNISRVQESRDSNERGSRKNNWEYLGVLDTSNLPPRDGMAQMWVRTSILEKDDQSNVFNKINHGWRPRQASTVSKEAGAPIVKYQGADVIGVQGNILMERPEDVHEEHLAYIRSQTESQTEAVDAQLGLVHDKSSGLTRPQFTNETASSVSGGRSVQVAPD